MPSAFQRCAFAAAALLLVSCGDPPPPLAPTAPICKTTGSSTLDGVRIEFPPQSCRFTLAEVKRGIPLQYLVTVESHVAGVASQQGAGTCSPYGPSGLIVSTRITPADRPPAASEPSACREETRRASTLALGVYASAVAWDGTDREVALAPGDTSGKPLPPGRYTLDLRARGNRGPRPFEVRGTMEIILSP